MAASSYPPSIDGAEQQRLVEVIKDWSIAQGLAVRPPAAAVAAVAGAASAGQDIELASTLAMTAPVTLFPSAFPRSCFQEAQAVQQTYNELYAKISQDEAFLSRIVAEVAGGDEFTKSLWDVHLRVKAEGYVHKHSLGIFRSDYMVHQELHDDGSSHLQIKQVEFNTIAASFGGLSEQTSKLHRFLAQTEYPLLRVAESGGAGTNYSYKLPRNGSQQGIAAGLQAAFDAYEASEAATLGLERCILFLTQDGERNVFDQRHIEYAVTGCGRGGPAGSSSSSSTDGEPGTRRPAAVFRLAFSQILKQTSIAATPRRQLLYHHHTAGGGVHGVFEVAVVYLRAGYGPGDYPDQSAWDARYQVERSAAIKCPSVLTQVAGTKKVQQVLATPEERSASVSELGRFFAAAGSAGTSTTTSTPADKEAAVRRTFAGIYPLDADSTAGRQARAWAQDAQACRRFVLKPQREGGGNNYYKDKIPAHLQTVPPEHWASYILMELITPPPVANLILRNGRVEQGGVICELGIYGTCVWEVGKAGEAAGGRILQNETAGYLLRTKGDQSEEGGVAAGFGSMDSCNLV